MPNTTNFNWATPADTDLVKDGAAAIRTLGNSIDTSLVDLKGGTTGQVLAKTSNTDMDFTWVAQDDVDAIQKSLIDAEGDLIVGDSADEVQRLAIGSNGNVLTVDTAVDGKIKWAAPASSSVNKNYLINGGFAISQRATSFTSTGSANNDDSYTLDRWYILSDTNDVIDVTQDTTTVPTNGQFAIALDVETVNKKFGIATIIENKDVIGLVGNTVTFSFKAKVSSTTKLDNVKAAIVAWSGTADTVTSDIISAWGAEGTNPTLIANATYENSPANLSLTTSYATYSVSGAVDTASTKNLILFIWSDVTDTTAGDFLYIAEAKLELGSSATAFQYAGGTIAGELEACQRYYQLICSGLNKLVGLGYYQAAGQFNQVVELQVALRVAPTLSIVTGSNYYRIVYGTDDFDGMALYGFGLDTERVIALVSNLGVVGGVAGSASLVHTNNASAFIAVQAEL